MRLTQVLILVKNFYLVGEHSRTVENMSDGVMDDQRQSPPKAVVDSSPLQPQINKNKECKYLIFIL